MSTTLDKQRAEDRRAKVLKMNFTKVKPTVVKHVLPNEVMSIYDPKVSKLSTLTPFWIRCTKINYTCKMTYLWRKSKSPSSQLALSISSTPSLLWVEEHWPARHLPTLAHSEWSQQPKAKTWLTNCRKACVTWQTFSETSSVIIQIPTCKWLPLRVSSSCAVSITWALLVVLS